MILLLLLLFMSFLHFLLIAIYSHIYDKSKKYDITEYKKIVEYTEKNAISYEISVDGSNYYNLINKKIYLAEEPKNVKYKDAYILAHEIGHYLDYRDKNLSRIRIYQANNILGKSILFILFFSNIFYTFVQSIFLFYIIIILYMIGSVLVMLNISKKFSIEYRAWKIGKEVIHKCKIEDDLLKYYNRISAINNVMQCIPWIIFFLIVSFSVFYFVVYINIYK